MVDLSPKAAQFEAMLAQLHSQRQSPSQESPERSNNADPLPNSLDAPSTPPIITPGCTPGLGSWMQGTRGNIDPELLAGYPDEDSNRRNEHSNTSEEDEDDRGNDEVDQGEYQDLRQRLAMTKKLKASSVQELASFAKVTYNASQASLCSLACPVPTE